MTHIQLSTVTEIRFCGGKSEFIVDFRLFRGSRVANEDKIKAAIRPAPSVARSMIAPAISTILSRRALYRSDRLTGR